MSIGRGESQYEAGSGSGPPLPSGRPDPVALLESLEVLPYVWSAAPVPGHVVGSFGAESAVESYFGGDQSRAVRTFSGIGILYELAGGGSVRIESAAARETTSERALSSAVDALIRAEATGPVQVMSWADSEPLLAADLEHRLSSGEALDVAMLVSGQPRTFQVRRWSDGASVYVGTIGTAIVTISVVDYDGTIAIEPTLDLSGYLPDPGRPSGAGWARALQ